MPWTSDFGRTDGRTDHYRAPAERTPDKTTSMSPRRTDFSTLNLRVRHLLFSSVALGADS